MKKVYTLVKFEMTSLTFVHKKYIETKCTFMDGLYQHLQNHGHQYHISQLESMLEKEEYDSDALILDVEDDEDSNVSILINQKYIYDLIKEYVYDTKCMLCMIYKHLCNYKTKEF